MTKPVLIEICVESLDHAVAAERGGADRIELCHDLSCGGVTPSVELTRAVREQVRIPIHVLIRPRAGDFCYSGQEFETMQREISIAKEIGLDGIVLGILNSSRQVDRERTSALAESAHPLPVTVHRAFDDCSDPTAALEAVIETGAKRILTSGGRPSVLDGLVEVKRLLKGAQDRIVIMPGGGIRSSNVERILRSVGVREIHTSLDGSAQKSTITPKSVVEYSAALASDSFAERVRNFKSAVEKTSSTASTDKESDAKRNEGYQRLS